MTPIGLEVESDRRTSQVRRTTRESNIVVELDLDGSKGLIAVDTGIGILDHLLTSLASHAGFDLRIDADGDLEVDDHHVAEDCAIAFARAISSALGDRGNIMRFGWALIPLDEALSRVAVDLVSRPSATIDLGLARPMVGGLASENAIHFLETLALTAPFTLHVAVLEGRNDHHRLESAFKALAISLREAVRVSGGTITTKGTMQ
ncbi:MAG: imidazoleglycerol-phosphate dehydratase [Phycisphaera sp.]|nr:imidazoleglycerol-phosphate dehydratase [Phycisphaera sp.]